MSVPSVTIAKNRLRTLIIADRMHCTPDMTEKFTKDVYLAVSKYIEISPEDFHLTVNRSDIRITFTGERA
ncbi:MAG: cell division topological specificity factor MinE [Hespellia sp.]|nr:cell division topological specificity factor MinE [Hespellia sp.]